jgi:methylthioribose-1-phosphate isomerase
MDALHPLRIEPPRLSILDQTMLPSEEHYLDISTVDALCEAIRNLRVRGAPLLGLAGAAGMALAAATSSAGDAELESAATVLTGTRPTAVDLGARVQEALALALLERGTDARRSALWMFASQVLETRQAEDAALGAFGADLLPHGAAVLTHCNAGGLATGGIGTALGVVRTAWARGRLRECYATETRPLLQGARLTMWELQRSGITATLLPDSAAAALLASGRINAVVAGADRIAANGDTANKVGTYGLAAVAARHRVPFYIAAPTSTFDASCADGGDIPIEFRDAAEVGGFGQQRWSPAGTRAFNPAFDVTPAELITAVVSEQGVARPPYRASLGAFL